METLVFGGGGAEDKNVKNHATWLIKTNQVNYTPLHWLAYWNDFKSINFLLKQIDKEEPIETIEKLISLNTSEMTALDVAGTHESHEAAMLIIEYFF